MKELGEISRKQFRKKFDRKKQHDGPFETKVWDKKLGKLIDGKTNVYTEDVAPRAEKPKNGAVRCICPKTGEVLEVIKPGDEKFTAFKPKFNSYTGKKSAGAGQKIAAESYYDGRDDLEYVANYEKRFIEDARNRGVIV